MSDRSVLSIALLLIFAALFVISLHTIIIKKEDSRRHELLFTLDSLQREQDNNLRKIDSVLFLSDSLRASLQEAYEFNAYKDKQIEQLLGKYNDTPQDSLGVIMDRRAANNK